MATQGVIKAKLKGDTLMEVDPGFDPILVPRWAEITILDPKPTVGDNLWVEAEWDVWPFFLGIRRKYRGYIHHTAID